MYVALETGKNTSLYLPHNTIHVRIFKNDEK